MSRVLLDTSAYAAHLHDHPQVIVDFVKTIPSAP
jgi:hypothetical protein